MLGSREQIAEELRRSGLRATAPRVAIYAAVSGLPGHPDVQEIIARVRGGNGDRVSTQAVYDCLRSLSGSGLLRRIEPAGSPARYESRVGDNHHHVVCRVCGATHDVDCAVGAAPCLDPGSAGGFAIEEAEVTFWGVCPECQAAAAPTQPKSTSPAGRTSEP